MNEKKNPVLRFSGFSDAWEQRPFGEIVNSYTDPVSTPHDGYYRLGIRSHAKGTFHSYVEAGQELETAQMHRVAADKFIVNITFGWEHAVAITTENDEDKLVSHRFPQFSFVDNQYPRFYKYVIVDDRFRHHLWLASPGGAGRNRVLKIDEMLTYKVRYPSIEEQKRIYSLFERLDHLISLHQSEHEKLKNIKKSLLDKMFPRKGCLQPEVRIGGFTDDWEQRYLFEYLEVSNEKNTNEIYAKQDVLSVSGDYGIINQIEFQGRSFAGASVSNYGVVHTGDVVYTKSPLNSNPYGIIKANKGKTGIVSTLYAVYHPKKNVDSNFVQIYFEQHARMNNYMHPLVNKGAKNDMKVSSENALKGFVIFPKIEEQHRIVDIFQNIDVLINLHRHKYEKLLNLKKALLRQMII